ncbi:MAG: glycosyltransferase family 39 protein [Candidatus Omnitrophota bacterium]|nr:glycosyltransferase family 39 protein [Candidatus Omnitrophota bacterium]
MRDTRFIILLLVVTVFLYFFGRGTMALTDPDETFYAQSAKEMLNAGEWVTPLIFGEPQFEKPAFYYWLVMASYMVFGVNEFAARFPSALFGIAGVIGVYFLGRLLFSRRCGLLSGLVLATCVQYIVLARGCVTDMVLSVFILYCLLFFLAGWMTGRGPYFLVSAVMAALAVLTKGPIGLFIPGVVILLYMLFSGQWRNLRNIPVGWCILVFLAVSLPWYIAISRAHGAAFIDDFFLFRNITRFLEPEHECSASPFFYVPVFIMGFFPWSLFLPLGAWNIYRGKGDGPGLKGWKMFLLVWFLAVFVFFSVSRTKLVTYILPLYPVAAVLVGRFWEKFIYGEDVKGVLARHMNISYAVFSMTSIFGLVGVFFLVRFKYPQALTGAVVAETVFAAGLALSLLFFIFNRKRAAFFSIVLSVVLLCVPLVRYVLPVIEEFETTKALSLTFRELSAPGEPLGGETDSRRGIAFYSGRTEVVDIHPYPALKGFISRKERVWGIVQHKHYEQLKGEVGNAVSEPVSRSGDNVLITNKPLAEREK